MDDIYLVGGDERPCVERKVVRVGWDSIIFRLVPLCFRHREASRVRTQ